MEGLEADSELRLTRTARTRHELEQEDEVLSDFQSDFREALATSDYAKVAADVADIVRANGLLLKRELHDFRN